MSWKSDLGKATSLLTLNQRIEWLAIEMQNIESLTVGDPWRRSMFEAIEEREYQLAQQKASGNWEPRDPPGFEGGFAENH